MPQRVAFAFGQILTGPLAVAYLLASAVVYLLAAYWIYRRQMRGWWIGLGMLLISWVSFLWIVARVPIGDAATALRLPPNTASTFVAHEPALRIAGIIGIMLTSVIYLAFMLWAKPVVSSADATAHMR